MIEPEPKVARNQDDTDGTTTHARRQQTASFARDTASHWEPAYEIRFGEWQDTPPAIFLYPVL